MDRRQRRRGRRRSRIERPSLARQVRLNNRQISRIQGSVDVKHHILTGTWLPTLAPTLTLLLNNPLQGVTDFQRIGNRITLRHLRLHFLVRNGDAISVLPFRFFICHNSRHDGAPVLNMLDVLLDTTDQHVAMASVTNPRYHSQYSLRNDVLITAGSSNSGHPTNYIRYSVNIPIKTSITFSGNPPVVNDPTFIVDHSYWLVIIALNLNWNFAYTSDLSFTDL
jgi:hypothetical protein